MSRQAALTASVRYLEDRIGVRPQLAVVLGSGLKALEDLTNAVAIPYAQIPHFPVSTVEGHSGVMTFGHWGSIPMVVLRGRFHRYEGYPIEDVVYPLTVLAQLGLKELVLTNAAGGINLTFTPADLMLIQENLDFMPLNLETGASTFSLETVPVRGCPYDAALQDLIRTAAIEEGLLLREGRYAALLGPTYETAAEIEMLRCVGADAVGMSTAPEANWAQHLGIKTVAVSCITNVHSDALAMASVSHQEVVDVAASASARLDRLFKRFFQLKM